MKILVIGGTGLIGSQVVNKLRDLGHNVVSGSPSTGINTITGEGLAAAMTDTAVVIDLANTPTFEDKEVLEFFETSGRNLLATEINANVQFHVALSIVGTDRLQESGYFRGKKAQEELIKKSGVPYTIIHCTQFMEFLEGLAAYAPEEGSVTVSPAKIQPIASDEAATMIVNIALGSPVNGIIEIAGPEIFKLSELLQRYLIRENNLLTVIEDEDALYYGAKLDEDALIPAAGSIHGTITFEEWFC